MKKKKGLKQGEMLERDWDARKTFQTGCAGEASPGGGWLTWLRLYKEHEEHLEGQGALTAGGSLGVEPQGGLMAGASLRGREQREGGGGSHRS